MTEIRIAQARETGRQKEIWKRCFGDENIYIDRYFEHRYRAEETALALVDGQIASMLTMLPVTFHSAMGESLRGAMIYAVATHPDYRGKGLANRVMDFADRYLSSQEVGMTLLVPASAGLFDFYAKRGYTRRFYVREGLVNRGELDCACEGCTVAPARPEEYNQLREHLLAGSCYVGHSVLDLSYQKMSSQASGCDIYRLCWRGQIGCAIAERLSPQRVAIKELLVNDDMLPAALSALAERLTAQDYLLRLPQDKGSAWGGKVRCLGVSKPTGEADFLPADETGYLGICFD